MSHPFLSQAEQWPDRCAANRHPMHPEETPDPSDFAAEDFDRQRRQRYPRGEGPPLQGEDDPHDLDPEGASLDDHDPDLYLPDPGFVEEEVDDWPDPDHMRDYREAGTGHRRDVDPGPPGHASQEYLDYIYGPGGEESPLVGGMLEDLARHPERAHPYGTPTYTPGGGIPHEDYDPNSLDNLPPDEPGGEDIHHFGATNARPQSHEKILKQLEAKGGTHHWMSLSEDLPTLKAIRALAANGDVVIEREGTDVAGRVNIRVKKAAARFYDHPEPEIAIRNDDVTIMHVPEEDGPGYDAIVRKSPDGKGWDVLRPLG